MRRLVSAACEFEGSGGVLHMAARGTGVLLGHYTSWTPCESLSYMTRHAHIY